MLGRGAGQDRKEGGRDLRGNCVARHRSAQSLGKYMVMVELKLSALGQFKASVQA